MSEPLNTAVFDTFPRINTPRLLLREIQLPDAEQIFAMRADGRVNQFIARNNMQNPQDAAALTTRTIEAYQQRKGIGWAGQLLDSDTIIGTCGFNSIDFDNRRAEIGGEMSAEYWKQGLALEAVLAIIRFGFDTMHLHAITARISPHNRAAIAVVEKIGFKKEAHFVDSIFFDGQFQDSTVYTLHNK
jgi:[ribosomal protein S5]-alanine N-acetyltransferase